MTIEFDRDQIRAVDRWRIELEPVPSRAEAIRKLLDVAVEAESREKRR